MTTVSSQDFLKGKQPVAVEPISSPVSQTPSEKSGVVEFGKGVAKGALGTVKDIQDLGNTVLDTLGLPKAKGIKLPNTDASNSSQKAGKVAETIAEFLIPFASTEKAGQIASKGAKVVDNLATKGSEIASKAPEKVAKAVLGEADTQIIKSSQNPVAQQFIKGTKKVKDVVSSVEKTITQFETESKSALQAVKNSIPDVSLEVRQIAEKVNKGIMDSIQHSADYKGVKIGLETPEQIINSGILKPEESKRIEDVVKFIKKWGEAGDTSARGVLNLKESLANFYATGENYTGSNAVVRSIQRNLVDLVAETYPEIKPALKTASQNIDKTEQFIQHLFGKDAVTGESKILTLARNLQDKAKNGFKVDLVKELEKATGVNIHGDLQGIYDYLQASKLKAPGLQKPLESAKYVIKKGIEKTIKLK